MFKIVGAASIIAKVTRDRYVHGWVDPEDRPAPVTSDATVVGKDADADVDVEMATKDEEDATAIARGSGYPSDPKTQAFLRESMDPVFGYKGVVRFSWATVKVILEKNGVECRWCVQSSPPRPAVRQACGCHAAPDGQLPPPALLSRLTGIWSSGILAGAALTR